VNPPDVLTLDTEGTEYEILEGAVQLLEHDVVCVVTEVAFLPFREGQKLYGDVARYLLERGFLPISIRQHVPEMALYRAPVGLRGRGIETIADAIFLKDPALVASGGSGQETATKLRKLAIAALAVGQLEYALDSLKRARDAGVPDIDNPPAYWSFLDLLERCAADVESRFLPTPGARTAGPTNLARGTGEGNGQRIVSLETIKAPVKRFFAQRPQLWGALLPKIASAVQVWRGATFFLQRHLGSRSPVEQLLANYGFAELSEYVRLLRLTQAPWASRQF
jgi:hypothetical protein